MDPGNILSLLVALPKQYGRTINDLPYETLEHLFRLAKIGPVKPRITEHYEGDPNEISPNEDYPLFKTLRQVCKTWHDVATPLLFRTVVLWSHIGSWQNLNSIVSTPWLATHVHIVHLVTTRHLQPYSNYKQWRQAVYSDTAGERPLFETSDPNGGPLARLQMTQHGYYRRFEKWRDGEQAMAIHHTQRKIPPLYLDRLTHLSRVETIGHDELAVIKKKYKYRPHASWFGHWRAYENDTRREVETHVRDTTTCSGDVSPDHIDMFLTAVQKCGLTLDTLAIRNTQELFKSVYPVTASSLRCLELNLGLHEWGVTHWNPAQWPLSHWFRTMSNLEEVRVAMTARGTDVFELLSDITWPRLRKASFVKVRADCSSIIGFLDRHRENLEELLIDGSDMRSEEWEKLCTLETVEKWQSERKRLVLIKLGNQ